MLLTGLSTFLKDVLVCNFFERGKIEYSIEFFLYFQLPFSILFTDSRIQFFVQNFSDKPSSSKSKTEDLISFSSPSKVCPPTSIPPHLLFNSSAGSLGADFEFSDQSTDNSQTDDLISFNSNDFSSEQNEETDARRLENDNAETKKSVNETAHTEPAVKINSVPEYRVGTIEIEYPLQRKWNEVR